MSNGFLPISKQDMIDEGIEQLDFVYVCGDAYVDHPSFGAAVIGRILEAEGLRVAIVPQPNWRDDLRDFKKLGRMMSLYPYSECRALAFWFRQVIWTPW